MIYRVNTMVVWLTIAQGTDFFREGLEHGYFVMRKDRKGPRQLDFWQPGMALVDFTNPAATNGIPINCVHFWIWVWTALRQTLVSVFQRESGR